MNLFTFHSFQTGPVRLFTPYKRRRRTRETSDGETPSRKHKNNDNSRDESNDNESDTEVVIPDKEVAWPQFISTDGLVVTQAPDQETAATVVQAIHQSENGQSEEQQFKKFDEVSNKLLKIAYDFKRVLEEAKEQSRQQKREQSLVAQLTARGDVIESVALQPTADSHEKKVRIELNLLYMMTMFFLITMFLLCFVWLQCANCNRDSLHECSLCRRTPYCSAFCQRKDWGVHQVECVRGTETVMLIVESNTGETSCMQANTGEQ